jgi:hypothetical protein
VGGPGEHGGGGLRQAVEAQRLELDLSVEADDADLGEGDATADDAHRLAPVERGVRHAGADDPGLRRAVPAHGRAGGEHPRIGVGEQVLPRIEAPDEESPAIGATDQPVRERELPGLGGIDHEGEATIGIEQRPACCC